MPGPNQRCDRCYAWRKIEQADPQIFPHGLGQCCLNPPRDANINAWPETTGDMGCVKGFTSRFVEHDEEGARRYG